MDQVLQFVFVLIAKGIVEIRPLLPIICIVLAWGFTAMLLWNLVVTVRRSAAGIRKLHSIPCAGCQYSTCDYRLKCSVHPIEAFSEQAISCQDFEPVEASFHASPSYLR
ncbi:MAG: hypothetical protein WBB01_24180 [Phormidesmis sp.]